MADRMKIVNGKPVFCDEYDRDKMMEIINHVFDEMDKKDEIIEKQGREIDRPNDEKLAEAHVEIDRLKKELSRVRRNSLYELSDEDREKSHEFWEEHRKICKGKGSRMEWVVWGTGIGSCLEYRCKYCGEKIDLTDVSNW